MSPLLTAARQARAQGRAMAAVPLLQQAHAERPDDPLVLQEIGLIAVDLGDLANALGALLRALDLRPELDEAARALCGLLEFNQITEDSPQVARVFERLLARSDVATQPLVRSALNVVMRRPAVRQAVALADPERPGALWAAMPEAVLADTLLRRVLERGLNREPDIELLLTRLRRDFLFGEVALTEPHLGFAVALAQQAHNNEFVFLDSDEERIAVAAARDRLADADPRDLLRVAMYQPLTAQPDAERLLAMPWPAAVAALVERILGAHAEEQRLRADLPSLAPITDAVSALVSAHYEDNPYPRWFSLTVPRPGIRLRTVRELGIGGAPPRVLIAGGGTGKQSVFNALAYGPSVEVLAIDLSRASLAYSMRQARAYGATNPRHMHGDLLQVDRLPGLFDVIECTGVLVCVRDPAAALRGLVAKLRPGGLLYLALYSEVARADVVQARALIAERGLADTPDAMRRFRHDIMTGPDSPLRAELLASPGFYSLSTCRDFLFHRVENRFTAPRVRDLLRGCGLRFRAWDLPPVALARFQHRFGDAADMADFDQWDIFERENPRTFRGMYTFWSQKPATAVETAVA